MRLKSMNKANSITISRKNNSSSATTSLQEQHDINYEINSGESAFDLNMDSGDDEIDVGTNADSMLINFNNNSNTSDNSYQNIGNSLVAQGNQNDQQFGSGDSIGSFAMPQSSSAMTEADRKRAHHNALERKRRDHIKDSFHTLRDAIPNIKGEKVSTSRAQILKAATDYIKTMKTRNTVFQSDIDLLKKQNNEIELQIQKLEKAKMSASECLRQQQSFQIKNEIDLNDSTSSTTSIAYNENLNDFKFELNENKNNSNTHSQMSKNSNVLVMTKQSTLLGSIPSTSKKFKTIVNTKTNNMLNNNGNYF